MFDLFYTPTYGHSPLYYKLDKTNGTTSPANRWEAEQELRNHSQRILGRTYLLLKGHKILISTIFRVFDANLNKDKPALFETMVFVQAKDRKSIPKFELQRRTLYYSTAREALEGHKACIVFVKLWYKKKLWYKNKIRHYSDLRYPKHQGLDF